MIYTTDQQDIMIDQQANRLGEIVQSNSDGFISQCYELYKAPSIGTLVRAGVEHPVFGIVCHISTEGIHSDRKAIARGQNETSVSELYSNNPQIAQLLVTNFEVASLASSINNQIFYGLPASPPKIHAFVFQCSKTELDQFYSELDFLPLLAARSLSTLGQADELLVSSLKFMISSHSEPSKFTRELVSELSRIFQTDLSRLKLLIRRLKL